MSPAAATATAVPAAATPTTAAADTGLAVAAEKVRILAALHAEEADRTRALAPDVVEALRGAGFARHFVAARYGGAEGSFAELTRAVLTVAEGCAATAWNASLCAYSARFAAHLPAEGHEELWGGGPDVLVVTGLIPSGRAVPAEGGWRLSGTWGYVSGAEYADWALLCAAAPPVPGSADSAPELRFFALPRAAVTVRETWDAAGMRASGSHAVAVADAFVPAHLSYARSAMLTGRNEASAAPCHNVPFQAVGGLTFIGPAVGAASGALAAAVEVLAGKRRTEPAELDLIRASAAIDAARLLVAQNAEVIDAAAFTPDLMARNERNATYAAELVTDAVGLLVRAAGTAGLSEGRPLQRFWRDVVTAASHVALKYETAARRNWAAALLGPAPAPPAPAPAPAPGK